MGSDAPGVAKANRGPAAGPSNRAALIRAAREVFSESGLSAPLSAIAKRAGVGQGSLYRHFSSRTALAAAVFDENLALLEASVAAPERTIDDLFDGVVAQAVTSTALIDLVSGARDDEGVIALGTRFRGVIDVLLDRERAAGRIDERIEADDIILATSMLAGEIARTAPAERAVVSRRARALFQRAFAPRLTPSGTPEAAR